MRVLIIDIGSRLNMMGGQQRMATILTNGLGKRFETWYLGYKTIFTSNKPNEIILDRGSSALSLKRSRLGELKPARIAYNALVVGRLGGLGISKISLLRRIEALKPDIIIANSPNDFPLLTYLRKGGLRFKSVYIDHGSISTNVGGYFTKEGIPIAFGTGIHALTIERALTRFFGFFDMVVALNKDHLKNIRRFTKRVVLINNGLDIKPLKKSSPSIFRRSYGIKRMDFVVGYVGRLFERQKNVSVLIKAFMMIKGNNYRLLIVGEGPSEEEYRKLAGRDKRIIFTGRITLEGKKLGDIYNSMDAMVLPSNWEGLTLTVLEAANYSVPLIVSESAYIEDLKDKRIGRLLSFPTNDPEKLRQCILALRSRREFDREVEASKAIARIFTGIAMLKKYEHMIEEL